MDEELKKLLQKNYALTKQTYLMVKDIRSYLRWQKFWSWIKILIIVIPIILTIIYLPPFIDSFIKQYQGILGGANSSSVVNSLLKGSSGIDVQSLPPELKKYLQ